MAILGGAVAAIAIGASLAASGVGAYYAYKASEDQARAINYQKRQAQINAKQARDAAAASAELAHERHKRILAAQRMALGASGVTSDEGSPLMLQLDAAEQAALEEARIRNAGATAATGLENQARLFRAQAKDVRTAGYIGAGTTLLGGISRAAGSYYDYSSSNPSSGGSTGYSTSSGYQSYRAGERRAY